MADPLKFKMPQYDPWDENLRRLQRRRNPNIGVDPTLTPSHIPYTTIPSHGANQPVVSPTPLAAPTRRLTSPRPRPNLLPIRRSAPELTGDMGRVERDPGMDYQTMGSAPSGGESDYVPPLASDRGVPEYADIEEGLPDEPLKAGKKQTLAERWANLDDATKRNLGLSALVSGLGILSRQRYSTTPQSPIADIGEGGLQGVQTYLTLEQRDEANRQKEQALLNQRLQREGQAANWAETRRLTEQRDLATAKNAAEARRLQGKGIEEQAAYRKEILGPFFKSRGRLADVQAEREPTVTVSGAEIPGKGTGTVVLGAQSGQIKSFVPTGEKTIPIGTRHSYASGPEGQQSTDVWQGKEKGWVNKATGKPASATRALEATKRWELKSDISSAQSDYAAAMKEWRDRLNVAVKETGNATIQNIQNDPNLSKEEKQTRLTAAIFSGGSGFKPEQAKAFMDQLTLINAVNKRAKERIKAKYGREDFWKDAEKELDDISKEATPPASSGKINTPAVFDPSLFK